MTEELTHKVCCPPLLVILQTPHPIFKSGFVGIVERNVTGVFISAGGIEYD